MVHRSMFDQMLLETLCPDFHKEYMVGNFSFQKTKKNKFFGLAIDQIQEQNNKIIKGSGGA